jgi:phage shock protein E
MISFLKNLFGRESKVDYKQLIKDGAIILDVRTANEFAGGHAKNAINISVDSLSNNLGKLKNKQQPIITCCASDTRSGIAKRILLAKDYKQVYNGGTWQRVNKMVTG